ncbi:Rco1p [Sporobolomyces koalae]|uniref:Rco1p n=1 Tax=Sporobolomyces koalae TaxID=500713 RepID=UPI00317E8654
MSASTGIEPSPLGNSTAPSASPPASAQSVSGSTTATSGTNQADNDAKSAPNGTTNGVTPSASVPAAAGANEATQHAAKPAVPLEDQEMRAFGSVAEQDILPPPPRDPNAPLGGPESVADSASMNGGTKRSMGTGATAAGGPLARAKRPKNVKFSPTKVGKQLARRSAAPGAAGAEVMLANNDFCDSCGGKGHFLCCEGGCLRSFHFGCLEPPLEIDEVPEESWFCKACRAKTQPPPRLPAGFFSELIDNIERENPKAFALSAEVRQLYKNVAVGLNGEFINSIEHRPPSRITGRAVGQEDRDGYRLKDKNGRPIICYHCSQAANPHIHRRIISCDFCDQHWHLDCLNPPMTGMPPPTRKWMCPVHSEHVLPKKRIPRAVEVINAEERGVPNNGDVIVQPAPEKAPPEEYEEMTVNRIRYQVPEQNIILDFWGKVVPPSRRTSGKRSRKRSSSRRNQRNGNGYESGHSSSLTDLSSSEDEGGDKTRERSAKASVAPVNPLDNLALLAEVRYIDLLSAQDNSARERATSESDRAAAKPPTAHARASSRPIPSQASASTTTPSANVTASPAASSRFSLAAIPPFSAGPSSPNVASPAQSNSHVSASGRHVSPTLSPAPPTGVVSSRFAATQAELTVQSKEDLKALMQVRKLLSSQGQAQGSAKTTMLSFLEGAPIIPKLAFVSNTSNSNNNNNKAAPWPRPWDPKKDGSRPSGPGQTSTPAGSSTSVNNSPKPASPTPVPARVPEAPTTSHTPTIKVEGGTSARSVPIPKNRSPAPAHSPTLSSSAKTLPPAPLPPSTRPSHSPVLASHHIPTPYSSDMPFQLPAFRPPSATPTPSPRTDAMDLDSKAE